MISRRFDLVEDLTDSAANGEVARIRSSSESSSATSTLRSNTGTQGVVKEFYCHETAVLHTVQQAAPCMHPCMCPTPRMRMFKPPSGSPAPAPRHGPMLLVPMHAQGGRHAAAPVQVELNQNTRRSPRMHSVPSYATSCMHENFAERKQLAGRCYQRVNGCEQTQPKRERKQAQQTQENSGTKQVLVRISVRMGKEVATCGLQYTPAAAARLGHCNKAADAPLACHNASLNRDAGTERPSRAPHRPGGPWTHGQHAPGAISATCAL